ncbi:hypothetical protein HNV12_29780 [Methanococcoides sp. SA1]|nr:hypothetical protein [Methanococcoides sp. SA1]
MNTESFFENFELFAESPNAIKKLREMILQIAVQGKLMPQNPDDEPAEVLLENIRVEKERLLKEGKVKKTKPFAPVDKNKIPYEIPKNWEWIRFGEITICRDGERIPVSKSERSTREGQYDYYGASGIIDDINDYIFGSVENLFSV